MPEAAERFHLSAVPAKKKVKSGKREWEPELWVGDVEPKPSLATGLLWAVNEAPRSPFAERYLVCPWSLAVANGRWHWCMGWVVVSACSIWNSRFFNVFVYGFRKKDSVTERLRQKKVY